MNGDTGKIEEVLSKALAMLEEGQAKEQIYASFPEYRQEIDEMLEGVAILEAGKSHVLPHKELLVKIIEGVTERGGFGYTYNRGGTKGRPSIQRGIVNEIESLLMSWKTWVPLGVVAVIVIILVASQGGSGGSSSDLSLSALQGEEMGIDQIDFSLDDVVITDPDFDSSLGVTVQPAGGVTTKDPFGSSAIDKESNAVGFDSNLNTFFSDINDIDSSLSNL